MKTIITTLIFLLATAAFAQNAPLTIKVTDFDNKVLEGEQVLFVEKVSQKTFKGVSDKKGVIEMELPVGKYDIKIKSIGEANDFSTFEIPPLEQGQTYQRASMQIQIAELKEFTLDDLHFYTGKWTIRKSSHKVLNDLAEYLRLKEDIKIEISGHTDSDGDEASNLELSQKRADAVKKYLISKGIKSDRISTKGFGESKPIADNSSPEGKALNRRTEVKIL